MKGGTGIKSGIVMVTNSLNGLPKAQVSRTEPMKLQLTGDKLILLREDSGGADNDHQQDIVLVTDGTISSRNLAAIAAALPNLEEFRTVKLVREKSVGFGLSIKGGCEHGLPILISGLVKDGPADKSRQLFIGDAIVRIDDLTLSPLTTTHEEGIKLLKQAGIEVNLTVKHFKMVSPFLTKCWKKKLALEAGNLMAATNNNNGVKDEKKAVASKTNLIESTITSRVKNETNQAAESESNLKTKANGSYTTANNNNNAVNSKKWIPLISIDLVACFVTKYIHDSDKIRPHGFEIRWLTKLNDLSSCPCLSSTSSAALSFSSSASSSSSSTTSLSTPKSTDSGVGVGLNRNPSNSTLTSSNPILDLGDGVGGVTGNNSKNYSSAIVNCSNQEVYKEWFTNIDKSVKNIALNQIKLLNRVIPVHDRVLYMGWVSQGTPSSKCEPARPCYRWTTRYLVIKGGDALVYLKPPKGLLCCTNNHSSIPWSEGRPYLFKAHQSVLRCLKRSEYVDERENCFLLLSCDTNYHSSLDSSTSSVPSSTKGKNSTTTTAQSKSCPTTICYLSTETSNELARIRNNWNRATYHSVTQLGSKKFTVICAGKSGSLTLDWRLGFAFYDSLKQKYDWCYKFSQLKTSSDDGGTTLWLSFQIPSTQSNDQLITKSTVNSGEGTVITNSPSKQSTATSSTTRGSLQAATTTPTHVVSTATARVNVGESTASSAPPVPPPRSSTLASRLVPSLGTKFTIETREIKTDQLQNLLYCMHAFLTAKVISVDQAFLSS